MSPHRVFGDKIKIRMVYTEVYVLLWTKTTIGRKEGERVGSRGKSPEALSLRKLNL